MVHKDTEHSYPCAGHKCADTPVHCITGCVIRGGLNIKGNHGGCSYSIWIILIMLVFCDDLFRNCIILLWNRNQFTSQTLLHPYGKLHVMCVCDLITGTSVKCYWEDLEAYIFN